MGDSIYFGLDHNANNSLAQKMFGRLKNLLKNKKPLF
jgi:hypothetical protein